MFFPLVTANWIWLLEHNRQFYLVNMDNQTWYYSDNENIEIEVSIEASNDLKLV